MKETVKSAPPSHMATVSDYRRENLRRYISNNGGTAAVGLKLGHSSGSFLVQMTGPRPTRVISEKSARKFEEKLGLPQGELDKPLDDCQHIAIAAPFWSSSNEVKSDVSASSSSIQRTIDLMRSIESLCYENAINVNIPKFITLVQQALLLSSSKGGDFTIDDLAPLVELMKP